MVALSAQYLRESVEPGSARPQVRGDADALRLQERNRAAALGGRAIRAVHHVLPDLVLDRLDPHVHELAAALGEERGRLLVDEARVDEALHRDPDV